MQTMTKDLANHDSIWNSVFIGAFLVNLLMHISTEAMNTLVPKYVNYLGATAEIVGVVASMFAITALAFKLVSAPAIDCFNRKKVLLFSTSIITFAMFSYSISTTIPMVIFSRLLQGVGQAFSTTCCLTIASDSLPSHRMSSGVGYFSLGTAICQAVSPTIGLKLAALLGYRMSFFILCITACCGVISGWILVSAETPHNKKFRIRIEHIIAIEAVPCAVLMFLLMLSFCVIKTFLVLYAEGRNPELSNTIGYYFTVYAVTMLFTRPFIGKMSDKYGTVKVVIPAIFCFAASFVIISFASTLPVFLLAAFIAAFGYGGAQPAIQALCMKSVPKERRGAASCTAYIGNDMGNLVGPLIAGVVCSQWGYIIMWRIMLIPMLAALLLLLAIKPYIEKIQAQ